MVSVRMSEETARKWQNLVERRRASLEELRSTGHWRRHYSEEFFRTLMEDTDRLAETWANALKACANTEQAPSSFETPASANASSGSSG
jgi:hypothetical protein